MKLAWEGLVANEFHGLVFTDAAAAAAGSATGQKAAAGSGPRAYATGDEAKNCATLSLSLFASSSSMCSIFRTSMIHFFGFSELFDATDTRL